MTAPKEVTETIYTDTVAVLPGYARAVAADLRASSERWRQYQDPPSYFDDALGGLMYQMSPAASEAYQDDSVLGRALKVASGLPSIALCHKSAYMHLKDGCRQWQGSPPTLLIRLGGPDEPHVSCCQGCLQDDSVLGRA